MKIKQLNCDEIKKYKENNLTYWLQTNHICENDYGRLVWVEDTYNEGISANEPLTVNELKKIDVIYIDGTTQRFITTRWSTKSEIILIKNTYTKDDIEYEYTVAHIVLSQVKCIMYAD